MRCIFDSKMYAIKSMLFLGKCDPCSKRYWVVQIETIHHPVTTLVLKMAFSTGDIIYFPIIIRRLHGLKQRRPTMLCMFFENGLKKTKTEAKFGPVSMTNIIGSRTHTDTHWRRCYLTRMARRPSVRPTLSSTRSSVPAKFLSTWSRSVAYYHSITVLQ